MFKQKHAESKGNGIDMTPMVDVTFLLLIFFMVTASFTMAESFAVRPAVTPSLKPVETTETPFVEVTIDENNSYHVASFESREVEAPSDREMRAQIRDAMLLTGCDRLVIKAHTDSAHGKAVAVWDAGIALGMQQIEMETIDEDF